MHRPAGAFEIFIALHGGKHNAEVVIKALVQQVDFTAGIDAAFPGEELKVGHDQVAVFDPGVGQQFTDFGIFPQLPGQLFLIVGVQAFHGGKLVAQCIHHDVVQVNAVQNTVIQLQVHLPQSGLQQFIHGVALGFGIHGE